MATRAGTCRASVENVRKPYCFRWSSVMHSRRTAMEPAGSVAIVLVTALIALIASNKFGGAVVSEKRRRRRAIAPTWRRSASLSVAAFSIRKIRKGGAVLASEGVRAAVAVSRNSIHGPGRIEAVVV